MQLALENNKSSYERFAKLLMLVFVIAIPSENLVGKYEMFGSITRIFGIFAFTFTLMNIIARGYIYVIPKMFFLLVCYIVWSGATCFWSLDVTKTYQILLTNLQLLLMLWLFYQLIDTRRYLFCIMKAYILGCFLLCFIVIFNYHNNIISIEDAGRFTAGNYDPNYLAATMVIAIPMAWYIMSREYRLSNLVIYTGYIMFCLISIIITGSRGVLLAAIVALFPVSYSIFRMNIFKKLLVILMIALVMSSSVLFLPTELFDRFSTIGYEISQGDAAGRKELWKAGEKVFLNHTWLGVGDGAYSTAINKIIHTRNEAHQTFLGALAELGVIGAGMLFLFLLINICLIIMKFGSDERVLLICLIGTWCIVGCSLVVMLCKFTWLLFSIIFAFFRYSKNTIRRSVLYANDTCKQCNSKILR